MDGGVVEWITRLRCSEDSETVRSFSRCDALHVTRAEANIYYFKARFSLCLFSISFVASLSAFFAANKGKMTEAQPTSVASLTTGSSKAEKENAQIKQTTLQFFIKDTPSLKRKRTLTVKPGGKDFVVLAILNVIPTLFYRGARPGVCYPSP